MLLNPRIAVKNIDSEVRFNTCLGVKNSRVFVNFLRLRKKSYLKLFMA